MLKSNDARTVQQALTPGANGPPQAFNTMSLRPQLMFVPLHGPRRCIGKQTGWGNVNTIGISGAPC